MKLFYVPENIAQKNPYNAASPKNHYLNVTKQNFKLIAPVELPSALTEQKQIISFSPIGFERLLSLGVIVECEVPEEKEEAVVEVNYKCNFHMLSPIYSAVNKFLGTGVILLGAGVPEYAALPIALVGASCNFWVQYNFITKSANGPKTLDYKHDDTQQVVDGHNWRDECMAAATVISSITEGAGFAAGVFLTADANNIGLSSSLALCAIAFKFRQGTTMQADGQKIFIENGKRFADTYVGTLANLTQQFPPKYPFLIDFNSWIRDFLPALESLQPFMAFNAFLQRRIDNPVLCLALGTLVSSGEWYQQRGYSVNLIRHVQQLSDTASPLGFAHLVDIIIRLYNETIDNLVNGRWVNDAIGIVIPPAIWQLIVKIAGNFFTGYVGGQEVVKLLPDIAQKIGFTFPEGFAATEDYLKPIIGVVCAIAAYSQYTAGYDKSLRGLPIGIKALLKQVYNNASLTAFNGEAIKARYKGWVTHVGQAPHRFFKLCNDVGLEIKTNYQCERNEKEASPVLDLEKGLNARLMS